MSPDVSNIKELDTPALDSAEFTDMLDLLLILSTQKRVIIITIVTITLGAVLTSFLLPNAYTGNVKLLPPQQPASTGMLGQLGLLSGLSPRDLGLKTPQDVYLEMLRSRSLLDAIITQHKLQEVYDKRFLSDARDKLADKTDITSSREGAISISVEDKDPIRAAAIANSYAEELKKLSQNLSSSEAGERKQFFERQLRTASEDLRNAEMQMKSTQEKSGMIHLDSETRAVIEGIARLQAQISAQEIYLQSMGTSRTEQNPEMVRGEEQLRALRGQLAKLQRQQGGGDG
ncbi:MAG: Wzz/FepE/Etk N-terminal domain-containing protein, partial [Terriglobales bacterium]